MSSRDENRKEGLKGCPYCGNESSYIQSAKDYNRKVTDETFTLRACRSCGLHFIHNPPADMAPYYDSEFHYIPKTKEELLAMQPSHEFKVHLLQQFKKGGSLLEIGPSSGQFCALAQDAGFDVSAIELDAGCVDFLNKTLGVRAICSGDPAGILRKEETRYDAICLWHSLEHIAEPWEVLRMAADRLQPGGVLLVALPNPESTQARFMKGRWPHHDMPRHLYAFPRSWIEKRAAEQGLKAEFTTTSDPGSLFCTRLSWAILARDLGKRIHVRGLLWRAGMLLGRLLRPLEAREGRGAAYVSVFRRPE